MFSRLFAKREAGRKLHSMTDRELEDIGITRGEINRAVSTGFI